MATSEAVAIIAALDIQSAAFRLQAMEIECALNVLGSMDEIAAIVRLGSMPGSAAARLLCAMTETQARYFISLFPGELIERVVGTEYILDVLPLISEDVTAQNLCQTAARTIWKNEPHVIAHFLQSMHDERWLDVWLELTTGSRSKVFRSIPGHFWSFVNVLPPERAAMICFEAGQDVEIMPDVLQFICNLTQSAAVMSWFWLYMERQHNPLHIRLAIDILEHGPLLGYVLGNLSTAQAARILGIAFSHPMDAKYPHVAEWRALKVGFTLGRFPEQAAWEMCSALPKKYAKKAWSHRTEFLKRNAT
ncbi:hypothetical protein ACFY20_46245 [Streptomyces sp. NPDC001312]|uniref:hypothetical protein n=1 Tax=Streptomyces sp. NPDC001312 TaxID=3364561 RepID=UPI00368DF579